MMPMSNKTDVWAGLTADRGQRVDAASKFDFFWAVLEDDCPALVLFLPAGAAEVENLPKLKQIDVRFRNLDKRAFVLRLLDHSQKEPFFAMCRDIFEAAEVAETVELALNRAIRRTRRWHFLLKGGSTLGLSTEEQRGLVGELTFLRELSDEIGPAAAIEAWKGPEGSSKDFEFPHCCIEIKARRGAAKPYVRISSEDQLSNVEGGNLFLRVYNIDSAVLPDGETLHGHVVLTAKCFEENDWAYAQWQDLIDATGYASEGDYADRRWIVGLARTFEVVQGFPRIVAPIPEGVGSLTYAIALSACEPFITLNETPLLAAGNTVNG
jgi:hypothetical protein